MKIIVYLIITYTIFLYGCTKQETVIDNPMLLRGEVGRLWLLNYMEDENPQYLWFNQHGFCQVLEFGITKPILVISDVHLPLNMDSCLDIPVLLNGLPYRMYQTNKEESGWEGFNEILKETIYILTRTFTPEEENVEWYRIWHAHYYPSSEEISWFLTPSFNLIENHPLNGCWESLSDSMILLNGQSFLMIEEEKPLEGYAYTPKTKRPAYFERWIILHNTETGDSIELYDAHIPTYDDAYDVNDNQALVNYKYWMKRWKKNNQKSILLKGERFKLYHAIYKEENKHYWSHDGYAYFDDSGIYKFFHDTDGVFLLWGDIDVRSATLWHQNGDTIHAGDNPYRSSMGLFSIVNTVPEHVRDLDNSRFIDK